MKGCTRTPPPSWQLTRPRRSPWASGTVRPTQKDNELQARINRATGDYQRMNHREPDADSRRLIRTKEGAQYFRELNGRNPADKEELGKFITAQTKPAAPDRRRL